MVGITWSGMLAKFLMTLIRLNFNTSTEIWTRNCNIFIQQEVFRKIWYIQEKLLLSVWDFLLSSCGKIIDLLVFILLVIAFMRMSQGFPRFPLH